MLHRLRLLVVHWSTWCLIWLTFAAAVGIEDWRAWTIAVAQATVAVYATQQEQTMPPMMKCGHAANATNSRTGKPSCVICIGIHPGAEEIDGTPPDLSKRKARCAHYGQTAPAHKHESNYGCKRGQPCNCEQPSSPDLPFFAYQPHRDYDCFFCGCWGWD